MTTVLNVHEKHLNPQSTPPTGEVRLLYQDMTDKVRVAQQLSCLLTVIQDRQQNSREET